MPLVQLPQCPTLLAVLAEDAEGRMTERGTVMADAGQVRALVSSESSDIQLRTLRTVSDLLSLSGTVRLVRSSMQPPLISYA